MALLSDDAVIEALGEDGQVTVGESAYAKSFEIDGVVWTGVAGESSVTYSAEIEGATRDFVEYVSSPKGGAWYHGAFAGGARLLDASGNAAAEIEIGTKSSINHGVDFWASAITFPGNIQLIENYLCDYGTAYDYAPNGDDIAQNDEGQWVVCDTVTGATLAGTPNYLNLAKAAVENVKAGSYELASVEA